MFFKNLIFAASMSAIIISNTANAVIGPIKITLNPTEISSNYFNEDDTSAPFASEIYTEDDIKNSKSTNIYDFLTQNTSLSLAPSSGNRFSQKISARGYGLTVGSHNLVVTLNGRRLNNIDTSGPSINIININDVEKIEITKGSGSVVYGDSAMAGAIHVFTKKNLETKVTVAMGSSGLVQTSASVGINEEKIDLNLSIDRLKLGGYSAAGPDGNKDKGKQTNSNISARYTTDAGTEIQLDYQTNKSDNRYPNALTKAQYDTDPSQNGNTSRKYTLREVDSNTATYSIKRALTDSLTLSRSTSILNKDSQNTYYYSTGPNKLIYDSISTDYILSYKKGGLKIDSGYTSFDGSRTAPKATTYVPANTTSKINTGLFSQIQLTNKDTTYSFGARKELVEYEYNPIIKSTSAGNWLHRFDKHHLEAFDLGFNTKLNQNTAIFSNYNQAFQAPLIDRFFNFDGVWNGFMSPSTSKTINIGVNHFTDKSKTKVTLYRSNISNEMFYNNSTIKNTNLDKSHKQGLELQNLFVVSPKWSTNVNYAYTNAIIDKEADNSAFNGKTNPMTSKHNITASVIYGFNDKANMTLTQKYRSKAFVEEDYSNTSSQKQQAYNSTNFNFSYNPNDDLEFKFDVENLFKNSYGTWVRADAIYPGNSSRNIKAELSYKF